MKINVFQLVGIMLVFRVFQWNPTRDPFSIVDMLFFISGCCLIIFKVED